MRPRVVIKSRSEVPSKWIFHGALGMSSGGNRWLIVEGWEIMSSLCGICFGCISCKGGKAWIQAVTENSPTIAYPWKLLKLSTNFLKALCIMLPYCIAGISVKLIFDNHVPMPMWIAHSWWLSYRPPIWVTIASDYFDSFSSCTLQQMDCKVFQMLVISSSIN